MSLVIAYLVLLLVLPAKSARSNKSRSRQLITSQPSIRPWNANAIGSETRKGGMVKTESPLREVATLNPSVSSVSLPTTAFIIWNPSNQPSVVEVPVISTASQDEQPSRKDAPKSVESAQLASPSTPYTTQPRALINQAPSRKPIDSPTTTQQYPTSESMQPPIISYVPTSSPLATGNEKGHASNSDVQSLEFYRNRLFSPICSVFFPDEIILNDKAVAALESTVKRFITENLDDVNLPVVIVNVKGVEVVSQVSIWKRPSRILRANSSGAETGLDAYFRVDVVVTGYATKEELEHSFQELIDSNSIIFKTSIKVTAVGSEMNSTQLTLIAVAGCSGFVALILTVSIFMLKKKSRGKQLSSPKPIKKAKSSPKSKYPVQESRISRGGGRLELDNVSSCDGCNSLLL